MQDIIEFGTCAKSSYISALETIRIFVLYYLDQSFYFILVVSYVLIHSSS